MNDLCTLIGIVAQEVENLYGFNPANTTPTTPKKVFVLIESDGTDLASVVFDSYDKAFAEMWGRFNSLADDGSYVVETYIDAKGGYITLKEPMPAGTITWRIKECEIK